MNLEEIVTRLQRQYPMEKLSNLQECARMIAKFLDYHDLELRKKPVEMTCDCNYRFFMFETGGVCTKCGKLHAAAVKGATPSDEQGSA